MNESDTIFIIHDPFAVVEGSLMGPWGPANELLSKVDLDMIALHSRENFECLQFHKSNLLKQSAGQNKISRVASPFGKIYTSGK